MQAVPIQFCTEAKRGRALAGLWLLLFFGPASVNLWAQSDFINGAAPFPAPTISGITGQRTGDSTANASRELPPPAPGEPLHANPAPSDPAKNGGASIWYSWRAPFTGAATFTTFGSGFNTLMQAYVTNNASRPLSVTNITATLPGFGPAFNDDHAGFAGTSGFNPVTSLMTFTAQAGTTYFIAVDGPTNAVPPGPAGTNQGTVNLRWAILTNDNIASAQNIFGSSGTVPGASLGATVETAPGPIAEPNHAGIVGGASVWYHWVAPADAQIRFRVSNGAPNFMLPGTTRMLAVYSGPAVGATVANITPVLTQSVSGAGTITTPTGFIATKGQHYYIAVDGQFAQVGTAMANQGTFTLTWIGTTSTTAGHFDFSRSSYTVSEGESQSANDGGANVDANGALITVVRSGGTSGRMLVDVTTADSTARFGTDYAMIDLTTGSLITTTTLVFDDWQMSASFNVAIGDPVLLDGTRTFNVFISDVRPDAADDFGVLTPLPPGGPFLYEDPTLQPTWTGTPAAVNIADNDNFNPPNAGIMGFLRAVYFRTERVGTANIRVVRVGGDTSTSATVQWRIDFTSARGNGSNNGFALQAGSDYASPTTHVNTDFNDLSGTLTFPANSTQADIQIDVVNDTRVEFNEDLQIELVSNSGSPSPALSGGPPATGYSLDTGRRFATLVIVDDEIWERNAADGTNSEQPAGAVDRFHNRDFWALTSPPNNSNPGANGKVFSVVVEPGSSGNQKTILAGDFTAVNSTPRNRIARLNPDGQLDTSFAPGSGADQFINAMVRDATGRIYIGGGFSSYNGIARNGIARLNNLGGLDTTFDPGIGVNPGDVPGNAVEAIAIQPDGKILIAGNFTTVNNVSLKRIARLNTNGSVDTTFTPGLGADDIIYSIGIQTVGGATNIIIGGLFATYDGVARNRIAALNLNGTLNTSFNPGAGADDAVYAVQVQTDGKVLLAGTFASVDLRSRVRIARLNSDGSLDTTFDPGAGVNDAVFSMKLASSGKIYIGGQFTSYNGTRRVGIARLFPGGTLDTSFMDTAFNHFAGLVNELSQAPPNSCLAIDLETNGDVMIGGSFRRVGGGFYFAVDSDFFPFPGLTDANRPARLAVRNRSNVARLVGDRYPTLGPGNIGFASSTYTADEGGAIGASTFLTLVRTNGSLGEVSVLFSTSDATAAAGQDYAAITGQVATYPTSWDWFAGDIDWQIQDAWFGPSFNEDSPTSSFLYVDANDIYLATSPDSVIEGDENLNGRLTLPSPLSSVMNLGGESIALGVALERSQAKITISDDDFDHGELGFSVAGFSVNENGGSATISVIRRNGSAGQVSVQYATQPGLVGIPATANVDYQNVSGSLTFSSGITNRTFTVPMFNDFTVEPDKTITLTLTNTTGGATLSTTLNVATLTIIDDDFAQGRLNIPGTLTFSENVPVFPITVTRTGGSVGAASVKVITRAGSNIPPPNPALTPADFLIITNTLSWSNADSSTKTFFLTNNAVTNRVVDGDRTIDVILTNATGAALSLGFTSQTNTLTLADDDAYGSFSFNASAYTANENGGSVTVTILRTGGDAGAVSVDFQTVPNNYTFLPATDVNTGTERITVNAHGFANNAPVVLTNSVGGSLPAPLVEGTTYFITGTLANSFQVAATPGGAAINLTTIGAGTPTVLAADFGGVPTTPLSFVDGQISTNITITITNNLIADPNRVFQVQLSNPLPPATATVGVPNPATVTIVDDETFNQVAGSLDTTFSTAAGANGSIFAVGLQPSDQKLIVAGDFTMLNGLTRNRVGRLNTDGTFDDTFDPGAGPQGGAVRTLAIQNNGKVIMGGFFTNYDGTNRNFIVRVSTDGSMDSSFNPGSGPNGPVHAITLQANGQMLIGGEFTLFSSALRNSLARLGTNGLLDVTFDTGTGANGPVYGITVQDDGKVLVGGDFTIFNGVTNSYLVRLNTNGSLDTNFTANIGSALLGAVRSIVIQSSGKLVLGGSFVTTNGWSRIARLNRDGTLDMSFNPGTGANGTVLKLALQNDDRIVAVGSFTQFGGVNRNRITRLNADGATDPTINFGLGANNFTATAVLQTDGKIVFGGGFTQFDGTPRLYLARVHGGQIDGNGSLEFGAAEFTVNENTGPALITVRRRGGLSGTVTVTNYLNDGTAVAGTHYTNTANQVSFPPGEVLQNFLIGVVDDNAVNDDRTLSLSLDPASLGGGATLGGQPNARLTIVNDDAVIGFLTPAFSVAENVQGSNALITVVRSGSTVGTATVSYFVGTNGTATPALDYVATNDTLSFEAGETTLTFTVRILDDTLVEGSESIQLTLTNIVGIGGSARAGTATATLTIVDDDYLPGDLSFSASAYSVDEASGGISLNVVRTNGITGVVTVNFATRDGTAVTGGPNPDYSSTNGTLTFGDGETVKSFFIPVRLDSLSESNETLFVDLSAPTGGANLGTPNSARVTILNNDINLYGNVAFKTNTFAKAENATTTNALEAKITVTRTGLGTTGILSVNYATTNGTARPYPGSGPAAGFDYTNTTGVLTWADGEGGSKFFTVGLIDNSLVDGDRTVMLTLTNVLITTNDSTFPGNLGVPSTATLTITNEDSDVGVLLLSQAAYSVVENQTNIVINVLRTNGITGKISVDFVTSNSTALAGADYTNASSVLTFLSGETNQSVTIPIRDNTTIEGNRSFNIDLSNPTLFLSLPDGNDDFAITTTNLTAALGDPVRVRFQTTAGPAAANTNYTSVLKELIIDINPTVTTVNEVILAINTLDDFSAVKTEPDGPDTIAALPPNDAIPGLVVASASVVIVDDEPAAGSLDTSFNAGLGANAPINAVVYSQSTAKTVVGGDFTLFDGQSRTNVVRLNPNGTVDNSFNPLQVAFGGTNGSVRALAVYTNTANIDKVVIVGLFSSVNGVSRNNVARLNSDGTLDLTFNPGTGADNLVQAVAIENGGKIVIGGSFTSVGGTNRNFVARLNADGSADATFNPGFGPNSALRSVVIADDGTIVIGGAFTNYNGFARGEVARLNQDGSLDLTFDPEAGAVGGQVLSLALQADGKVVMGGAFTSVNGITRNRIARLNSNGSLDLTFTNRMGGVDATVNTVSIEPDGHVMLGGTFTTVEGVTRNRIARLNTDGSLDTTINFGTGANDVVNALVSQDDLKIVVAGAFTRFNEVPQNRIARLNSGNNLGAGIFTFSSSAFTVNENGTNVLITINRTVGLANTVSVDFSTVDGTATNGVHYANTLLSPTIVFAPGQTTTNVVINITDDGVTNANRTVNLLLSNPTNATVGVPSSALLTIVNDDSVVGFAAANYAVSESAGTATMTVTRVGGVTDPVSLDFSTITGGTATPGVDFTVNSGRLTIAAGQASTNFTVAILNDNLTEGDETVQLQLSNVSTNATLDPARNSAILVIVDDEFGPGTIGFSNNLFSVDEEDGAGGATNFTVRVFRMGGSQGSASVNFFTADGTATNGVMTGVLTNGDYTTRSLTLTFGDGEIFQDVVIPVHPDTVVEGNETFTINLANVTGGAALGTSAATVTIVDNDSQIEFTAVSYPVIESAGLAIITVARTGGTNGTVSVNIATADLPPGLGFAVAGQDYVATNANLVWTNGDAASKTLDVVINNDLDIEGPDDLRITLSALTPPTTVNTNNSVVLTILDDDFTGGSVDNTFTSGTIPGTGPNTNINAVLIQPDGRILIGGAFTTFDTTNVLNRIGRLNADATLDPLFNPGAGANGIVNALALDNNTDPLYATNVGKIVVGGFFTTFNGNVAGGVTRLNPDGSLDASFSAGVGADNAVYAVAVQTDGKVLIGGAFTSVGGTNRNYLARLNQDGSLDTAFLGTGTGADDVVRGITVAADGKILIAGHFTVYNGVNRRGVARLNTDGSLDASFLDWTLLGLPSEPVAGATGGPVLAVAFQVITNGGPPYATNLVIGGQFTAFNGQPRGGLALLDYSGQNEPGFQNPPANGYVGALAVQNDGKILLGGGFTAIAGLERNRLARLTTNGVIDTTINFGVGFNGPVAGIAVQADGRLVVGGAFTAYDNSPKNYLTRLHGGLNTNSGLLEFSAGSYSVSESGGTATLTVVRYGGLAGDVTVNHARSSAPPGNAVLNTDFTYNPGALVLSNGQYRATFTVGLLDNFVTNVTKVVNFDLVSTVPPDLVGGVFGVTTAALNILDDESILSFELANYSINESAGAATVTVTRGGSGVGPVSVDFLARDGTGQAGIDYTSAAGTLTWTDGDLTNKTFTVGILDNFVTNANRTVLLSLTNASPTNAVIVRTNATLTIIDNEFGPGFLAFGSANFEVNEGDGGVLAAITVVRTNGSQGPVSVTFATSDGTATNGVHYTGVSGALNWADGDVALKTFTVPILGDTDVNPARVVNLVLTNATGGAALGAPSAATLTILDNDTGLQFSAPTYSVQEDVTNVVITVVRPDALAGAVTVDFATIDGTATNGVPPAGDYTSTSGTLVFGQGVTSQSFLVPIRKDDQVETNETVILSLANATGGAKVSGALGTATLNIIDVRAGSVDLTFDPSVGANGTVLSIATRFDGTAVVGGRFTLINGTSRNRIAGLNADGTLDLNFNPGAGANDAVRVIALQRDSRILAGGDFTAIGTATNRNRIARLNTNGVVDATFTPGTGANGPVHALAFLTETNVVFDPFLSVFVTNVAEKIMVGGDFTDFDGTSLVRVARLLTNGVVDPTFAPGLGANGTVRAVAVQPDGKLILGGDFSQVGGTNRNFIARLNADGSPDTTFNPGTGPNAAVRAIVLQSDGKVLLGGDFTSIAGIGRNRIARLNSDGSVDGAFDPSTGADGPVTSLYLNKDGKPVIGGAFTTVSSVSRNRIARLNSNGSLDITFDPGAGANDVVFTVAIPPVPPTTTTNINLASAGGAAEERFVIDAGSTSGTLTIDYDFISVPDTLIIYYPPKAQGGAVIFTTGLTNGSATINVPFGPGASTQVELVMNEGSGQFGTAWFMSVSLTAGTVAKPETVLIGGDFTLVDGVSQNRFARLNEDGSIDTGYNSGAGANNTVNAIVLDPAGQMIVAGDFTLFNGVALNRVARLNPDGSIESSFNPGSGASGSVQALALQSDGKAIIGGLFTNYSGLAINRIARLGTNGALDLTFNPGAGANNSVLAVALQANKVLAGGGFTAINGVGQSFLTRLNADGALDPSFNSGAGANNAVRAIMVYTNGPNASKILIAGDFSSYNGTNRNFVARLNADGSLDLGFTNAFVNGPVFAVALQANQVIIGGLFTSVNGTNRNRIARLNDDGSLDTTFLATGSGADDLISAIAVDDSGRVLIGGGFSLFNDISRSHIARLTADGALDPTMNLGGGASGFVSAVAIQGTDGKVMIGGGFTMVDGILRNRIARLYGGQNLGNGILEFNSTSFTSSEVPGGRTETVTVVRRGGLTGQIRVNYRTSNGTSTNAAFNAAEGADYLLAEDKLTFEEGENSKTFTVTVLDDTAVELNETLNLTLTNVTTLTGLFGDGAIPGNNNAAALTIFDNDSIVGFALASYSVNESGSNAVITVSRTGGLVGSVAVNFAISNGTATNGVDYADASGTLIFGPGITSRSFLVPILDDSLPELNETVNLTLSNPLGAITLTNTTATLTIVDDELAPGELRLMTNSVFVAEAAGSVTFTVLRTNGIRGLVTVNYATSDGTAQAGSDYVSTSGTLSFADGETMKTFTIPITTDVLGEGDETINVTLFNPTGGGAVGAPGAATVTILDDDISVGFVFADYFVTENQTNGIITVIRTGGTNASVSVAYATTLTGTATNGVDFLSVSGSVAFAPGETNKTFTVPILDDAMVEPDKTVGLTVFNPTGGATLGTLTDATLTIRDNDANIRFGAPNYSVFEHATNAVISVVRVGLTNATMSVTYSTSSGSALAGLDCTNTTGVLTFAPGETNKTFLVGIINDLLVETNETLNLVLSSPTGGAALAPPSAAMLTILDNDLSFSFATNALSVTETPAGTDVVVDVRRQGATNVSATVNFTTGGGTATAGDDYVSTSGTLTFQAGETNKSFLVTVLDDTTVEGGETVNLALSSPVVVGSTTNGVSLVSPSSAVLTIADDGSTFAFSTNAYSVDEGAVGGAVSIAVVRGGITTGSASVTLSTLDGSAVSAGPNPDFVATNVVLTFAAGQLGTNVLIAIVNDTIVETNKTFTVQLSKSNPVDETVVTSPTNAVVTILDNDSALQFLAATNSVTEGANLVLTVVRSGAINSEVMVNFATSGGTAAAGADYVSTNGTLTFAPGVTNQSFTIQVIDDLVEEVAETFDVTLNAPQGEASLGAPTGTVVTIVDNDFLRLAAAGFTLVSESFVPASGGIDPGETVTVNFALTNIGNVNVTNVTATLLSTNGVTTTSPQTQNYGVIATNTSVTRLFTFKATSSNTITATLQLAAGTNPLPSVAYTILPGVSKSFTNSGLIAVPATVTVPPNGPAAPYPSVIAVSNLVGSVNKVTVTLNQLVHSYPDDIDMLLVGPGGQRLVLLSDGGGSNTIFTNSPVTLTFDDAATAAVPDAGQIVSGTYYPTNYGAADTFDAPAPAGPYAATNLSVFNGADPNGAWQLYVMDDASGDLGAIFTGWSLTIATIATTNPLVNLAVTVTAAPDPVFVTDLLSYTVALTNAGPNTATNVVFTSALPASVSFVSANPSQGTASTNANGLVVGSLGNLVVGGTATVNIVVKTTLAGSITNLVTAGANGTELLSTFVVTTVQGLQFNPAASEVTTNGDFSLNLIGRPNRVYVIEGSSDLITWTPIFTNGTLSGAVSFIDTNRSPQRFYRAIEQ